MRIEINLTRLRQQAIETDRIAAPPRIYLRGYFQGFDLDTQKLAIMISGSTEYYPISYYNGAWLPMPRQQVVVTRTHSFAPARSVFEFSDAEEVPREAREREARERGAPQIIAFAAKGKAIPEAPRVRFSVEGYNPGDGQLRVRDASGQTQFLTLPADYARYYDPDIRCGQVLEFRVVRVPPQRYFIPLLSESGPAATAHLEFLHSL